MATAVYYVIADTQHIQSLQSQQTLHSAGSVIGEQMYQTLQSQQIVLPQLQLHHQHNNTPQAQHFHSFQQGQPMFILAPQGSGAIAAPKDRHVVPAASGNNSPPAAATYVLAQAPMPNMTPPQYSSLIPVNNARNNVPTHPQMHQQHAGNVTAAGSGPGGAAARAEITCFACRGVGHKATQCPLHPRPIVPTSSADVIVTCAIHGKPRTSKNMYYNNQVGVWQCFQETTCKNLTLA